MRVGVGTQPDGLIRAVLAVHLREAEEELLLGREAIQLGQRGARQVVHESVERETNAAIVRRIFTERQLAFQVNSSRGAEAVILVDDAVGAVLEGFGVGSRPPVAEITLAVEAAA